MKRLHYSKQLFENVFKYDETSESCLRWITTNKVAGSKGSSGYVVQYKSTMYAVHRIIYCLFNQEISEDLVIDHIDGNYYNNNISNIRLISIRENNFNRRMQSNNTSGVTGVRYEESANRYICAWVDIDGKEKRKSFNIKKYESKEKAFTAAFNFRNKMIQYLIDNNLCYTDRHGK